VKLISGLGNPTKKYRMTRHNVGFLAIDRIAKDLSIKLKKSFSSSLIGKGSFESEKIILLKPLTFMNLSGEAIARLAKKKRIKPEEVIVICDDINLGLGKIRIRKSGGSGGHNGLKSIIEKLGTNQFQRMRIGIGSQGAGGRDLSDYVLEEFGKREFGLIDKVLDVVSEAIKTYLAEGIDMAMTRFNNVEIKA